MTNRIAIGLGLLFGLVLIYDALRLDWEFSLFVMRKFAEFIEFLAFWR